MACCKDCGKLSVNCDCGLASRESGATDVRKLKANGSNPSAPERKTFRTNVEMQIDTIEGMPAWAVAMQKSLMAHTSQQVSGLRREMDETAAVALQAQADLSTMRKEFQADVKSIRDEMKEDRQQFSLLREECRQYPGPSPGEKMNWTAKGKGKGKDGGKLAKKEEERSRTLTFSNFPEDTQEKDIIDEIKKKLKDSMEQVEEVFAFAKTGTRGAAKFTTEDALWKYTVDSKDSEVHEFQGRRIYSRAGNIGGDPSDANKEKAVRKVVRLLIERAGGDGAAVKKKIDAKYAWGGVWFLGDDSKWTKVAQWNAKDDKMTMLGEAAVMQATLDKMLE